MINKGSCSQSRPEEVEDDAHAVTPSPSAVGELTVKVEGEFSIRNADDLRAFLADSLARSPDLGLVVDLGDVPTCDAAALQLIWSLGKSAAACGKRLRLGAVSEAVASTAAALGLPFQELVDDGGSVAEPFSAASGEPAHGV